MSVEDCCAVCAEPLVWCGFGECGHTENCSKCVARWRFVLKDNSCMMCKQDQPAIFFTRFMGDFTPRLSSEQFTDLEARANRGELYHLQDIKGYFDDQAHFQLIKSLCGYTHPVISERCAAAGRETPIFTSINGMKKFVDMHYKMNFCDICLTSRKVFMCEQLLYNKADLDKHMKTGDETGPLAETSFKGHPICKFCRKRFYDSNDLFKHMESEHEQCFLCRRQNPGQYVYYRHYEELEEHFNSAHHPCPHPSCLEKKFVVFMAEHELKRHFASEHGDELKMSRAQRREALTIPVNLQYRDPAAEAAALAHALPGVTIGGGDQVVSRHGRNTASAQRARAAESAGQGSSSGYGGTNGYDDTPSSVAFTTEDFPQAQGMANGMSQMVGRWAGYSTGAEGSSSNNNGAGPSRGLSQEAFPSLPTMSKAAKKKLRAQQQSAGTSLADQLRAVNMPVRVISRASNTPPRPPSNQPDPPARAAASSSAASSSRPASAAAPTAPAAPAASAAAASRSSILATNPAAAAVAAALMPSRGVTARTPAMPDRSAPPAPPEPNQSSLETAESVSSVSDYPPEPAPPVFRPAHLTVAAIAAGRGASDSPARPASSRPPAPPSADDFPSLPAAPPPAARGAVPAAGVARFSAAAGSRPVAGTSSFPPPAASSSVPSQPPPQLQGADFPSLPPTTAAGRRPVSATTKVLKPKTNPTTTSSMQRPSSWGQQLSQAGSSAPPAPAPAPAPASPARSASPALPGSSVSKGLQEANRQLISKIQSQLADDSRFATFKSQSQAFLRGDLAAPQYHEHVIQLGLMALVPELAALCPAADRRDALLAAHVAFVSTPAAQKPAAVSGGWVPPEVAIAAAEQAAQRASWSCPECTLTNAPEGVACEACGTMRPGYTPPPTDAFPSLASTYSSGRSSAAASSSATVPQAGSSNAAQDEALADGMGGKGKKKGGTKITIGLGAGTGPARSSAGPSNQASLRSQVEQARNLIANRGAGKSAWASAGGGTKLARMHGAINDAWGDN